jgi:hypothetical protein
MTEKRIRKMVPGSWREKLHEIIFEADTKLGKRFDIIILWAIILSVVVVMLESVNYIQEDYGSLIFIIEWFFTILFTIEYIARIITVNKPIKYIFSFFGLVDLLSILPSFIGLVFTNTHSLPDADIQSFEAIWFFESSQGVARCAGDQQTKDHGLPFGSASTCSRFGHSHVHH